MIEIELWLDFQSSAPQGRELLAVVGVDGEAVVVVAVDVHGAVVVVTDGAALADVVEGVFVVAAFDCIVVALCGAVVVDGVAAVVVADAGVEILLLKFLLMVLLQ